MKKTIVMLRFLSSTHVPALAMKGLSDAYETLGYETITLDVYSKNIKKDLAQLLEEKDVLFFQAANLHGWDLVLNENDKDFFYDLHDKWFVSVLDTPLNKSEALRKSGKKKILLMLDKAFIPLVKKITHPESLVVHYHNRVIDDCFVGMERNIKKIAKRDIDILFVGRVGANTDFMTKSKNYLKKILANKVVERAFHSKDKQIWDITMELLEKSWFLRTMLGFWNPYATEFLYFNWGISNLVRWKRRLRVIDELASLPPNIKVLVVTNDPSTIKGKFNPTSNVEFLPFQEWLRIVELMGNSKIVINVQPFHVYGAHERLLTAMAHGAVVASDNNPYLDERYREGEDILFYDFKEGNLSQKLVKYLHDPDRLSAMAVKGMEKTLKNDLLLNRAQDILSIVEQAENKAVP